MSAAPLNAGAPTAASFAFLVPYSAARALLSVREVLTCLNRQQSYVYELIDSGKLEAHNALPGQKVQRYQVTRRSVLAVLAESALYHPADIVPRVAEILATLPGEECVKVMASAEQLRAKRAASFGGKA